MFLVLGEKPSVALALAEVLGAKKREDGYLEGEGCVVSWCLGHLAEYAAPEVYDERYKKWEFADLPILPKTWELRIAKDKKEQFDEIARPKAPSTQTFLSCSGLKTYTRLESEQSQWQISCRSVRIYIVLINK